MGGLSSRSTWLCLLAGLLILYFGNLGNHGLFEVNEARYFEISWEMARTGDWLTPRLNFIKYFEKPPLAYWAAAASMRLFGESEWAGRFPIAIAAVLTILLTGWLGSAMADRRTGLCAAVVLATCLEFWLVGRILLMDLLLGLFTTGALACAWTILEERRSRHGWVIVFWVCLGLSMLTKGPVGPAIVALVLIPFLGWSGRHRIRELVSWPAVALGIAITLPWFLLVLWLHQGLWEYLVVFQTIDRVFTQVHERGGAIWYYLPVMAAGLFPWSLLAPGALMRLKARGPAGRFLLLWALMPLLLFSLMGSKLPTYVVPIFPAFALAIGWFWSQSADAVGRGTRATVAGLLLFALAIAAFLSGPPPPEIAPAFVHMIGMGGVLLLGGFLALLWMRRREPGRALAAVAASAVGFYLAAGSALGAVDRAYTTHGVVEQLRPCVGRDTVVAVYADYLYGLPYYLDRRVIHISFQRDLWSEAPDGYYYGTLAEFLARDDADRLVVMRRSELERISFRGREVGAFGKYVVLKPYPSVHGQAHREGGSHL